ncbi:TLD-domain-containing protein, partial [Baffinella frigidus]
QVRDWELLYSTKRSGMSMHTFFRQVSGRHDTVLLVKDDAGHTFGAFVPSPWKNAKGFYGTGECFVFKLAPTFQVCVLPRVCEYVGFGIPGLPAPFGVEE